MPGMAYNNPGKAIYWAYKLTSGHCPKDVQSILLLTEQIKKVQFNNSNLFYMIDYLLCHLL